MDKVRAQVQTHMHATWSALFRNDFVAAEEADAKVKALCPEMGGLPSCFRDRTLTGVEGDARSFLIGAVWTRNLPMAQFLLRRGAHCDDVYSDGDFRGSAMSELVRGPVDGTLDKDMLRLFLRDGAADLDADAGDDHGALSIRTVIQTGLLSVRASIYREVAEVMTQADPCSLFCW